MGFMCYFNYIATYKSIARVLCKEMYSVFYSLHTVSSIPINNLLI